MTNGIFKSLRFSGYARATNVMSTQSPMEFEWSVKLVGGWNACVGIASQLKREDSWIAGYDQNAILYRSRETGYREPGYRVLPVGVYIGSKVLCRTVAKHKIGDIIRFRFQPHAKKLLIDLVRI